MTGPRTNRQIRLASRPERAITPANWQHTTETAPPVAEGGVLVQTLLLSLDPAMRGWMNENATYIAPVEIGAVMRAGGIGRVVESSNDRFAVGDIVYGKLGAQEYAYVPQGDPQQVGLTKVDLRLGGMSQWLNVLGLPGMTAYFGLLDIGQPQPGQTVVVSGAAGAVGQTVGQLAKIAGARAVGIAGGPEKCAWVVNELGFDACIDYKAGPLAVREGLKTHCPNGVDVYFDNVGGDILDAVLARLAFKARIIVCGAISQYNNPQSVPDTGPRNYLSLLIQRARMEGMVVFDYTPRFGEAIDYLSAQLAQGKLKSREEIVEGGIDMFPEALDMLFAGRNFGKLALHIAD